jgi:hypothetical protein
MRLSTKLQIMCWVLMRHFLFGAVDNVGGMMVRNASTKVLSAVKKTNVDLMDVKEIMLSVNDLYVQIQTNEFFITYLKI